MSSHNSYTPPHVEHPFQPGGPSSGSGLGGPNPIRSPTGASHSPSAHSHPSTIPEIPSKFDSHPSILRQRGSTRVGSARLPGGRKESMGQMSKRVDFSLGMSGISSGADMGDIYDKPKVRVPVSFREAEVEEEERQEEGEGRSSRGEGASLGRTGSRESGSVRSRSRKGLFGRKSAERGSSDLEAQVGGGGGVPMSELAEIGRAHV